MLKRVTIYLDPKIHQAAKIKSAHAGLSVSEIVNEALRFSFEKEAVDFVAVKKKKEEKASAVYEALFKDLKQSGLIDQLNRLKKLR